MLKEILLLILITFIPGLELRASIPLGIIANGVSLPFGMSTAGFGMHWTLVFVVCVLANMLLGPIVFFLLHNVFQWLRWFKLFDKIYMIFVNRAQKKIQKYVDKYGLLGVALFIGMPIPGSGSWSGALGSYLIGLSYKRFIIANCIGVFIAGVLVTLITLTGKGIFTLIFG